LSLADDNPSENADMSNGIGAGSVRTLLGSPKAIGKFRGSIAMSNLGGGVDLGLTGSKYHLGGFDTLQCVC